MITVAYIVNSIQRGGPGNVVKNLIKNMDKKKYSIFLITLFDNYNNVDLVNELSEYGINIICCKGLNRYNCFFKGNYLVNEIITKNGINIIHSHGLIPDIISCKIRHYCAKISTLHCVLYEDYPEFYGKIKSTIMIPLHFHYLKKLDKIICCSKSVLLATKALNNSTFIRNGIDIIKQENSDVIFEKQKNSLIYLYMGQLRSRKNIVWLLQQFQKYHRPNEFLYVLGKGDQLDECNKIKDSNIKIVGFTNDIKSYLNMADVYITASKSEGFSISLLEALSYGLGIFVSDIPSHREVFDIDEGVYIGETFNDTNFENQLNCLRNNINKINNKKIKQFMQDNLSSKKMTDAYMKIYEEILRGI